MNKSIILHIIISGQHFYEWSYMQKFVFEYTALSSERSEPEQQGNS